jgi:hypothetical protein
VRELSKQMMRLVVAVHTGSFLSHEPRFLDAPTIAPRRPHVSAASRLIERPPAGFPKYR